jgi:uncharacterized protein (DUF934 family)
MSDLIKQNAIVADAWKRLTLQENETPESVALPVGPVLVPLEVWRARRRELVEREYGHGWTLGVWLAPDQGAEEIAADLDDFSVVAVLFPKATDGRGFTTARLLRERHGYRGELRAIGEVLHDQLFYMRRCGFDAFALRADQDAQEALNAFSAFDETYQTAADQPLPLFRRRGQTSPELVTST